MSATMTAPITPQAAAPAAVPVPVVAPVAPVAPVDQAIPAPPAPPAPDAGSSAPAPKYTQADYKILMEGGPAVQKAFADQLTDEETAIVAKGGLASLFAKEAAAVDPPPVAPAPGAEVPPPAQGTGSEDPAWLLNEDEYAKADPKTRAMFDALLDAHQKLEQAPPAEDPYANDPVIAWRRNALQSGVFDIPDAPTIDDIGGIELLQKLDEAFQQEDPNIWIKAASELVNSVSKEVIARQAATTQSKLDAAYETGARTAEFRSELKAFVRSIPDFKGINDDVIVRGPEGNAILNEKHPASEFARWIKDESMAGRLNDGYVQKYGFEPLWHLFQSDKAGGYGKMMAGLRQSLGSSITKKMSDVRANALKSIQAPSVGGQGFAGAQVNQSASEMYHGFDLATLSRDPNAARHAVDTFYKTGNKAASDGLVAAIQAYSAKQRAGGR